MTAYKIMSEKTNKPTIGYYEGAKLMYTQEDLDVIAAADEKRGYEDRKAHCYDKWYRYNRRDNGAAYDRGVVKFVNEKHTNKWSKEDECDFRLIECMH